MLFYLYLLFFISVSCFIFGISILLRSSNKLAYKRFSYLIMSSSIWALLIFIFLVTNFIYLFAYLYYLTAILIFIFLIKFSRDFPFYKKYKTNYLIDSILYIILIFFMIVLPIKNLSFIYNIDYPQFTTNTLYIIYFLILMILSC